MLPRRNTDSAKIFVVFFLFSLFHFQANSNEIVLASTHDVQEVDVSSLVAVQPFTWIGEDFDKESRRCSPFALLCPQRHNFYLY